MSGQVKLGQTKLGFIKSNQVKSGIEREGNLGREEKGRKGLRLTQIRSG